MDPPQSDHDFFSPSMPPPPSVIVVDPSREAVPFQFEGAMMPNQHRRREQAYDSDRCSSSSSSASSSFKSAHDQIAPVSADTYGLRQRRGGARPRAEQLHGRSTNGFHESWNPDGFDNLDRFDNLGGSWKPDGFDDLGGSWKPNGFDDLGGSWKPNGFDDLGGFWKPDAFGNLDGSWKPDGFDDLDGSWKPDGFDNLEVRNGSERRGDEDGYGGADDDHDDGNHARCMDASDERGSKHADEDADDGDRIHKGVEDSDGDGEGEKEGHSKSSASLTIRKDDVSSSLASCSKPRHGKPPRQEEKQKRKLEKLKRSRKKLYDYVCCRCASRLTVDCAAVCCCPLALVHLAVLALIRLPASLLWRMLGNLKSRVCAGRPPIQESEEQGSTRSMSPGVLTTTATDVDAVMDGSSSSQRGGAAVIRFESQKLRQHFGTGDFGFGGFPMRAD